MTRRPIPLDVTDLEKLEAEEREVAELLASGAIPEPPDDLTQEEATGWVFGYIAGYRQSIVDNACLDVPAVAERLGVKVDTVWKWRQRAVLPPPDGMVSGSPWWWPESIDEWAAETGRKSSADRSRR